MADAGGGPGSISAVSSSSGAPPAGIVGNLYGFGAINSGFGGSFAVAGAVASGRSWQQPGDPGPTLSGLSAQEVVGPPTSFGPKTIVVEKPQPPAVMPGRLMVPQVMASPVYQTLLSSQRNDGEMDANELCDFFDALSLDSDATGGLSAPTTEVMVDKFQRVMKDRQLNQRRLLEVEAKLSQLKQENVDLVMENLKLRAKASTASAMSTGDSGNLPVVRPSAVLGVLASGGGASSTWSARTLSSRSATPVPRAVTVPATSCPPSSGQMAAIRTATVGSLRTGSSSAPQQPLLVARSRSESPGPRAAWAATVVPGASSLAPRSAPKIPSSPPISPRVAACRVPSAPVVTVAALRQLTPISDRGRFPQLSTVSASHSMPGGFVTTPLGSAIASAHRSPRRHSLGGSALAPPASDPSLATSYSVPLAAATSVEPWQKAPYIIGSGAPQWGPHLAEMSKAFR